MAATNKSRLQRELREAAAQEKAPISNGVGESRIFAAPEGSFEPRRQLHVNGVPVPPELAHAIPYSNTDEGRAELNERPNVREDAHRVEVSTSQYDLERAQADRAAGMSFDKILAAGLDDGLQPWETPDPLKDVKRQMPAGFRPKLLSDKVVQVKGLRGWKPVVDPKTGNVLRVGNMAVGMMPEELAERRNEHYRSISEDKQQAAVDELQEGAARMMRDSGGSVRALEPNELVRDYRGTAESRIGLQSVRGNSEQGD